MSEDTTTIQISVENYKRLSGMKNPGDSFDDVVGRILDEREEPDGRLNQSEVNRGSDTGVESSDYSVQNSNKSATTEDEARENEPHPDSQIESSSYRQVILTSTNQLEDEVEQTILDLDLSTSVSQTKWIPAVQDAYLYLKEQGEASKRDFIKDVYPNEMAGYDNDQTWWRRVIRPSLASLPRVEKPDAGGKWKYIRDCE